MSIDNEDVFEIIYFSPSIWKRDINGLVGFDWGEIMNLISMLGIRGTKLTFQLLQKAEEMMMAHIKANPNG